MNEVRNYKIDFLRVASMLLIIIQHYVVWGVKPSQHALFDTSSVWGGVNLLTMEILYLFSCIGVNCFVMISGFFMINRSDFRWKSMINLWVITMFYSVVLYLITVALTGNFDQKELLNCTLPIWSRQYWFISTYMAVMLLAPFLSKLAIGLSKKSYQVLLFIMFGLSFVAPYGKQFAGGTSVMWMTFVFLFAGYIKMHGFNKKIVKHAGKIAVTLCLLYTTVFYAIDALKLHYFVGEGFQLHGFASDTPIFFISLALFLMAIRNTDGEKHKWMRFSVKIAPYILAVYLIHMNRHFYSYIWDFFIPEHYIMPMAIHSLLCGCVIFVACIAIDFVREWVFRVIGIPILINKISDKITVTTIK